MIAAAVCDGLTDGLTGEEWKKTSAHGRVKIPEGLTGCGLFAWLISHQPAVLFYHNKPATSNQPAVLFSQNKPAPAISHQPTEQAVGLVVIVLTHKCLWFSLIRIASFDLITI
jgi:hypothetical protein